MKQKLKRQLAMVLCMIMMLSCTAGIQKVNAISNGGHYIEISNLTSTSVTINWLPLVQAYYAEGMITESVKVTLSAAGYPDKVLADATTKAGVNISQLVPGEYYQIMVEPKYHYLADESNGTYDSYTGLEWNDFTTPASDVVVTEAPAATTQTPIATTQTPVVTTQVQPTALTVTAPKIKKIQMADTKVVINANTVTASGYEFRICTKKGKVVKKEESSLTATILYNIPANKVYYAQVRAYDYDANYNKVYSSWSAKKYFVAQPSINTNSKNISVHSIKLKWNKIKNASSYTVYMKKSTANKWNKVTTVKKNSLHVTRFKGAQLDTLKYKYDIRVVANAKVKGKKLKSSNNKYVRAYTEIR